MQDFLLRNDLIVDLIFYLQSTRLECYEISIRWKGDLIVVVICFGTT